MTTVKSLFAKITTLKGILSLVVILFIMNTTHFGRVIYAKIKSMFDLGMRGF